MRYSAHPSELLNDDRVLNIIQRKIKHLILVCLFFCITANKLLPVPMDKIGLVLFCIGFIVLHVREMAFSEGEWALFFGFTGITLISATVNISSFSFIVFFPLFGILFTFILSKKFYYLNLFYYAILLHIVIALFFLADSYVHGDNDHAIPMGSKGVPFLHSALGLTSTAQSLGTLCISALIIYYLRKDFKITGLVDKLAYPLITVGIFSTLNRSTVLAYFIVLFFKNRKLLALYGLGMLAVTIVYWQAILGFLFNTSTISSRSELLEGFNISFWQSHSLKVYLFGKADNQITPNILFDVKWSNRSDIENGHAMLLHTYGFLGYLTYIFICLAFVFRIFIKRNYYLAVIAFYYLIISPYLTQEYVTSTFYLILAIFIYMMLSYKNYSLKKTIRTS